MLLGKNIKSESPPQGNKRLKFLGVRYGDKQEIESLITEEAFILAKYLRNERKSWNPRIVNLLK